VKIVYVIWQDAAQLDCGPWVDRKTAPAPAPTIFHQVGYLYSLTPTEVVLTACMGEESMGARDLIPAGMVKSITELVHGEPIAIPKRRKRK
jgi:hypothetical protein